MRDYSNENGHDHIKNRANFRSKLEFFDENDQLDKVKEMTWIQVKRQDDL